ncbi:hypothetical protein L917_01360 [Phytophthora nicotianae]|uniref:Uncharacterized protein n=2 Tax=Phytophthora nicotianae TaxID=4792 RepID=W2LZR2_PHYNI|nr:hypothetical protein L917_01360 [Phytophthora nicotianae]ETO84612.1 hypothetical protein F444_01486 [Phytophthora nicotianae P1976]
MATLSTCIWLNYFAATLKIQGVEEDSTSLQEGDPT